jgi:hypothetical protein
MLGMSFAWFHNLKVFMMPFFAHTVRMGDAVEMRRRPLSWVTLLTAVVAMIATVIAIFSVCYADGGINMQHYFFQRAAKRPPTFADRMLTHPISAENGRFGARWSLTAAGAAFMGGLMFMQNRFTWWPLHPLALPFIPFSGAWTVVSLAWLTKLLILKYGGTRLFGKLRPLFIGLLLGKLFGSGVWFVIDTIFDKVGNRLYY